MGNVNSIKRVYVILTLFILSFNGIEFPSFRFFCMLVLHIDDHDTRTYVFGLKQLKSK